MEDYEPNDGEDAGFVKDVQRARSYLKEMIKEYPDVHLYSDLAEAAFKLCEDIIE